MLVSPSPHPNTLLFLGFEQLAIYLVEGCDLPIDLGWSQDEKKRPAGKTLWITSMKYPWSLSSTTDPWWMTFRSCKAEPGQRHLCRKNMNVQFLKFLRKQNTKKYLRKTSLLGVKGKGERKMRGREKISSLFWHPGVYMVCFLGLWAVQWWWVLSTQKFILFYFFFLH